MNFSLFTAVFFYIGWIVEVAADGRPKDCCLKVTDTKRPCEDIVRFDIQESPPCPIKAARFFTKKKKVICSDPNSDWAKTVIACLTPTEPPKCPTSMSTYKTTVAHTETSTSTTETTTKTSQPETSLSTTIETTRPQTSTSTTTETSTSKTHRSTTVTTIQTSQLKTDNSIRSTYQSKKSPQTSLNTVATCGPSEPITPATEIATNNPVTTSRTTSTTSARRTNPSRLKIRILKKKGKKVLRKHQNGGKKTGLFV